MNLLWDIVIISIKAVHCTNIQSIQDIVYCKDEVLFMIIEIIKALMKLSILIRFQNQLYLVL